MTPEAFAPVVLCCISLPFGRLSTTRGKITYVLLTRAPLYRGLLPFSCDLHVLSAPLTFVLSQDQTLQLDLESRSPLARLPKQQKTGSSCAVASLPSSILTCALAGGSLQGGPTRHHIFVGVTVSCETATPFTYDSVFKERRERNPLSRSDNFS